MQNNPHTTLITSSAPIAANTHGGRAKCLQRLVRLEMPVPRTVALSFEAVLRLAEGDVPDIGAVLEQFDSTALLCAGRWMRSLRMCRSIPTTTSCAATA